MNEISTWDIAKIWPTYWQGDLASIVSGWSAWRNRRIFHGFIEFSVSVPDVIRPVRDQKYGAKNSNEIGGWDGMVGELVRRVRLYSYLSLFKSHISTSMINEPNGPTEEVKFKRKQRHYKSECYKVNKISLFQNAILFIIRTKHWIRYFNSIYIGCFHRSSKMYLERWEWFSHECRTLVFPDVQKNNANKDDYHYAMMPSGISRFSFSDDKRRRQQYLLVFLPLNWTLFDWSYDSILNKESVKCILLYRFLIDVNNRSIKRHLCRIMIRK